MISTKNFLFILIVISFVFVSIKFYSFYNEYSEWQYSDWLINYQGGFVRRGLIGEIFFKFHKLSLVPLDFIIFIFVIFLYSSLSFFLIKSLKYFENSKINILIFLSPGFFLYPVMNSGIIGRKELLTIFFMGFFVFFEKYFTKKILFILFLASLVLTSLSHSGLLFFTPYIIFLYFIIKLKRYEKISYLELFLVAIILFSIFLILIFNSQTSILTISKICNSVKEYVIDNCLTSSQFRLLSVSTIDNISGFSSSVNYNNYFIIYPVSLFLANLFLGIKFYFSKFERNYSFLKKINPLMIIVLLFLFSLPIYVAGIDWGRWIYISYSCSFFIYLFCLKNRCLIFYDNKFFKKIIIKKPAMILLVFFYSFFWTFPFYNANNFKLVLIKPINQIVKKLN